MMFDKGSNMKEVFSIEIKMDKDIKSLQRDLNLIFPFLKIEFFRDPCIKGKGNSRDKLIPSTEILSRYLKKRKSGKILFTSQTRVEEMEGMFLNKFGLCMQVFRKSGNIWLETTSTDDWTLEQQNDEGKSLAQHFKTEREDPDDHDIY